jgi:hypothetical protein
MSSTKTRSWPLNFDIPQNQVSRSRRLVIHLLCKLALVCHTAAQPVLFERRGWSNRSPQNFLESRQQSFFTMDKEHWRVASFAVESGLVYEGKLDPTSVPSCDGSQHLVASGMHFQVLCWHGWEATGAGQEFKHLNTIYTSLAMCVTD